MTADAPLTDAERARLMDVAYCVGGLGRDHPFWPAVGSILAARETALRETIAQEIEADDDGDDWEVAETYERIVRIVRGQA